MTGRRPSAPRTGATCNAPSWAASPPPASPSNGRRPSPRRPRPPLQRLEPSVSIDRADESDLGEDGSLFVEEQRFAIVPEWMIDAELSDAAFRLYSLLLRYGNGSGCRMPSRALLARRLHRSVDSVDRAMSELVSAGMLRVERRRQGRQFLSNRYYVRTTPARGTSATSGG